LSERVKEVSDELRSDMATLHTFENRVLQAGFSPAMADRYPRRFCEGGARILPVSGAFPRLTRAVIGKGILRAKYEIDVDFIQTGEISLASALRSLGAL
ncbi:MAG: PD-(D/E)XK motif protein, partial [Actinobacteria bacterium]|nr:PD-(D/E)XK motif protein [Actinomycetota bacterium]